MLRKLRVMVPAQLFLIIFFAFFLRIINITNNPPALYGDELTMALDVNSILHTGFDQTGKFLPLNFSMGGGRPVGYGYFSLPFVALLGQGELGIRFLSILSGALIIVLIYHLGKKLFSHRVGILAAILMTISPWSLSISRGGFETHFALFLALLMVVSFLLSDQKKWMLVLSAFSLGFSINTYSTYKLSLPLFLPLLLWFKGLRINFSELRSNKYLGITTLVLLFFSTLLFYQVFFNSSESRFLNQNIFANSDIEFSISEKIEEQKSLSKEDDLIEKLFLNKYWEYSSLVTKNYLNSFSLDFLFISGDKNPRHNMTSSGALYLVELIFILFGLAFLLRKENFRKLFFLGGWLLIGPLPASLLNDPHALRSSFMLPPLILLSALGFLYLWNLRRSYLIKILLIALVTGLIIQFISIAHNLYFIYPNKYSRFWAYPAKMASKLAIDDKSKYEYVFISDRIDAVEFAYQVYADISPEEGLKQNKDKTKIGDFHFKKFENVYIGPIPDSAAEEFLATLPKSSILYIGPADDKRYLKEGFEVKNGKDGKEALVIKSYLNE